MLTASFRRVYRSRACRSAISASAACSDPTCTWFRPRLPRRNTSNSGQSPPGGRPPGPPGPAASVLAGIRHRRLPYPGTVGVGCPAAGDPFGVARSAAADDRLELGPVDLAEVVVAAFGVPAQLVVGQRDAEALGLRNRHIDEPLAQIVVGVPLDTPG